MVMQPSEAQEAADFVARLMKDYGYETVEEAIEQTTQAAGYGMRKLYDDEINVTDDLGFYRVVEFIDVEWNELGTEDHLMGIWEETPDDPLLVLIVHHDCDGDIYPAQQLALADRLEALRPHPLLAGATRGHLKRQGGYRGVIDQFVTGLRTAHSRDENITFS